MRDVEKWMPSMGNLKQFPPVKRIQKAKSRLTRQLGLPPPWLLFDFFRLPAWLQGVVSHLARWPDSNRFFLDLGIIFPFYHFKIMSNTQIPGPVAVAIPAALGISWCAGNPADVSIQRSHWRCHHHARALFWGPGGHCSVDSWDADSRLSRVGLGSIQWWIVKGC